MAMDQFFQTLEKQYIEGSYSEVITSLLSHSQDIQSGLYHYNLGTLYAKMGKMGIARFHFERALGQGNVSAMVMNNLSAVKESLTQSALQKPEGLSYQTLFSIGEMPDQIFLTFGLIVAIISIFVCRFRILKYWKHLLVVGLLGFIPYVTISLVKEDVNFAICLERSNILEGPSEIYKVNDELPEGIKVLLGDTKGDFIFIKAPEKYTGWVKRIDIGIL